MSHAIYHKVTGYTQSPSLSLMGMLRARTSVGASPSVSHQDSKSDTLLHHFHERLRESLAVSRILDAPASTGTDAEAVHTAPSSAFESV